MATGNAKTNRSIRVGDELWDECRAKIEKEAPNIQSMSQLVITLLEGYLQGRYVLPTVKLVYTDPKQS